MALVFQAANYRSVISIQTVVSCVYVRKYGSIAYRRDTETPQMF